MQHKITSPVISQHVVARTRLMERVDEATLHTRVVLVSAPAGFGKTTLMAQLCCGWSARGVDCAWLQLDEGDNDLSRFLASAMCALNSGQPTQGAPGGTEPGTGTPDPASELIAAIGQRERPFAFFIDDLESVSSPAVLSVLASAVNRLPPGATVVLASRGVPELGLARMRANGQLLEIDAAWLRLSEQETAEFMASRRGLLLSGEQIARLHARTDGWVTALWLASLALERYQNADEVIARLSGSNLNLAEYFQEVVLDTLPEAIREFLLKASVLRELTPQACNAVCGRHDSARVLAQLEEAHLFISAVDPDRRLYAFHSLFADFLKACLAQQPPEWRRELHRTASDWYLAQGRRIPAIAHALQAGPDTKSLGLLQAHADELLRQGRAGLLTRWLDPLPDATLNGYPQLRLAHAWAVAFTRGAHEALALVERVSMASGPVLSDDPDGATLRPFLWFMTDRVDEAYALALTQYTGDERAGFAPAMTAHTLANASLAMGHHDDARRYADAARMAGGTMSRFHFALADSVDGAVDLMQGRRTSALVRLQAASKANSASDKDSPDKLAGLPFPDTLLGEALYEGGDIAEAERLLRRAAPILLDIALPEQLITAHVLLARIERTRGDTEAALVYLERLESAGHRLHLARAVACARLERAWMCIDQGDFNEAGHQIEASGSTGYWTALETRSHLANDTATRPIAEARLAVRRGHPDQALALIKPMLAQAKLTGRFRRMLKLSILQAEAMYAGGQIKPAMRHLGETLALAARDGWVQSFVEEGAGVRALLTRHAESQDAGVVRDDAVLGADYLRALGVAQPATAIAPTIQAPGGTLTAKEIDVLRLLSQGCSNQAIAERLFVSTATVRAHLRNINVKLDASNRTQAVALARRLGVLG